MGDANALIVTFAVFIRNRSAIHHDIMDRVVPYLLWNIAIGSDRDLEDSKIRINCLK